MAGFSREGCQRMPKIRNLTAFKAKTQWTLWYHEVPIVKEEELSLWSKSLLKQKGENNKWGKKRRKLSSGLLSLLSYFELKAADHLQLILEQASYEDRPKRICV